MRKYSLFLLPLLLGIFLNGCESACCGPVEEKAAEQNDVTENPPIANINLSGVIDGECTPGNPVTLVPTSTDSDGTVTDNIWKIDGTVVGNTTISCPESGQTKTICLTAVDNDGLQSQEKCITITGKTATSVPTTTPPASIITKSTTFTDGQEFDCSSVHDTDTIHTYPDETFLYGSNTPKDIKEITWEYTYLKADGTIENGPNIKTQTQYNTDNNQAPGTCKKWFHTNNGVATINIKVTTLDDDHETTETAYIFDVATGTLTPQ